MTGTHALVRIRLNNFHKNLVKDQKRVSLFGFSCWFERLAMTHTLELESRSNDMIIVKTAIFRKSVKDDVYVAKITGVKDNTKLILRTFVNDMTLSIMEVESRPNAFN